MGQNIHLRYVYKKKRYVYFSVCIWIMSKLKEKQKKNTGAYKDQHDPKPEEEHRKQNQKQNPGN